MRSSTPPPGSGPADRQIEPIFLRIKKYRRPRARPGVGIDCAIGIARTRRLGKNKPSSPVVLPWARLVKRRPRFRLVIAQPMRHNHPAPPGGNWIDEIRPKLRHHIRLARYCAKAGDAALARRSRGQVILRAKIARILADRIAKCAGRIGIIMLVVKPTALPRAICSRRSSALGATR